MAVRQYVGARYVPKFADPVAWQNGESYEALTIVTYNNSSYTSKIPVPATVGNPADNPTYWALTGNYNAQIEEYRQETAQAVTTANTSKTAADNAQTAADNAQTAADNAQTAADNAQSVIDKNIKLNHYILVGDSYAQGYTPDGNVTPWTTLLQTYIGHNADKVIAISGGAFSATTESQNFASIINNQESDENITAVICCAGRNDANDTQFTDITTGIGNFVNNCKAKYPNATVYIGFIGWDIGLTEYSQSRSLLIARAMIAYETGGKYVVLNTSYALRQRAFMSSDGKHPNEAGQISIACTIYSCIKNGGIPKTGRTYHTFNTAIGNKNLVCREYLSDGIDYLAVEGVENLAVSYTGELHNVQLVLSENAGHPEYIIESGYGLTSVNVILQISCTGNKYYLVPGTLQWSPRDGGNSYLYAIFTVIADNAYPNETIESINIYGLAPTALGLS